MFGGLTMKIKSKPGETWFDERNRRKAAEDEELVAAFDAVEERTLDSALTRAFVANGVGRVEPFGAGERDRVAAMIARDRADKTAEHDRKRARIEVGNGSFVNLDETVLPPTPEWLAKGEVRSFTPRLIGEGGRTPTVKTVRTVRRLENSTITRMHLRGELTDEQLWACRWYSQIHERAGIEGRYKTSHLSLAGNVGGGGGGAQHPMAQHEREAEARLAYREARGKLTAFYVRFFEAVVIGDVPVRRAARFARCRAERAILRFRDTIGDLIEHLNRTGVEILPTRDRNED